MGRPKQLKKKQIQALSITHPNSRKAKKLAKDTIRESRMEKIKLASLIKRNIFGEKLMWFKEHLDPEAVVYSGPMALGLVESYLSRFNEELEQIEIKHSIGQRKNRQHANREDVIRMTISREAEEFSGAGIEVVDFLDPNQLELFKKWDGDMKHLSNFKLKRYSKKYLESYQPPKSSKAATLIAQKSTESRDETMT